MDELEGRADHRPVVGQPALVPWLSFAPLRLFEFHDASRPLIAKRSPPLSSVPESGPHLVSAWPSLRSDLVPSGAGFHIKQADVTGLEEASSPAEISAES